MKLWAKKVEANFKSFLVICKTLKINVSVIRFYMILKAFFKQLVVIYVILKKL